MLTPPQIMLIYFVLYFFGGGNLRFEVKYAYLEFLLKIILVIFVAQ